MKIFLDTANIDEIRAAAATGVLDGVTTNPSLVAKEGRPFTEVIAEICDIVDGPIITLRPEVCVRNYFDQLCRYAYARPFSAHRPLENEIGVQLFGDIRN